MKIIIKLTALLIPLMMFSKVDTSKVPQEAREPAVEILKNKRAIDSIHALKAQEVNKQLKIIALIKAKVEQLKQQKKITDQKEYVFMKAIDTANAMKPNTDAVYWEEVPRKWTGRLLNPTNTKIRVFRFENRRKIYLN